MPYLIQQFDDNGNVNYTQTVQELTEIRHVIDMGDDEDITFDVQTGLFTYIDRYTNSKSVVTHVHSTKPKSLMFRACAITLLRELPQTDPITEDDITQVVQQIQDTLREFIKK